MRRSALLLAAMSLLGACADDASNAPTAADGAPPIGDGPIPVDGGNLPADASGSDVDAGAVDCKPGEVFECYSGPSETRGKGRCRVGLRRCDIAGRLDPTCDAEVSPVAEDCTTPDDDDCDGVANESCACTAASTRSCYTGAAGTLGVGACIAGTQTCASTGDGFGACASEVTPQQELCGNGIDDDCDGKVDEEVTGCTCIPGSTQDCYTGPVGTVDIGRCRAGFATCLPDGSAFGACVGDITPGVESCGNYVDEDCDGETNEDGASCVCRPEVDTLACYSGPAGTSGVGTCKAGLRQCIADGTTYSTYCSSEVTPHRENCAEPQDEDCNGASAAACLQSEFLRLITPRIVGSAHRVARSPSGHTFAAIGHTQWLLLHHDANGAHLGTNELAPPSNFTISKLVADDTGLLIAGSCNGDFTWGSNVLSCGPSKPLLARITHAGQPVWVTVVSAESGRLLELNVDAQGSVYADGVVIGEIDIGGVSVGTPGMYSAALLKFDASGVPQWARAFRQPSGPIASAIRVLSNGDNLFLVHDENLPLTPRGPSLSISRRTAAGSLIWSQPLPGLDVPSSQEKLRIAELSDGTFRLAISGQGKLEVGTTTLESTYDNNWWSNIAGLVALDASGVPTKLTSLGAVTVQGLGVTTGNDLVLASRGCPTPEYSEFEFGYTRMKSDGTFIGAKVPFSEFQTYVLDADLAADGRSLLLGVSFSGLFIDGVKVADGEQQFLQVRSP